MYSRQAIQAPATNEEDNDVITTGGHPVTAAPPGPRAGGVRPPGTARATMKDVAALSGVSLKTVSRVVNDEPGVSPDLRERVRRAASRLDYSHNVQASNLRRSDRRTGTVGALLQDVGNSFSAALLRALEDVSREHATAVLAASLDEEPDRERELARGLVARRVDGLVIMPATERQDYLAHELRSGLPVVFVDREPHGVEADSVTVDNALGGELGARHLLRRGHRRLAFLSDLVSIQTAERRRAGFRRAVSTVAGAEVVERTDLRTAAAAEREVLGLFASGDGPTAVFAGRNEMAVGAARALRSLGLSHRVALVGFDDFPLADLLDPGLTVVRQDAARIGSEVGRLLFQRIQGDAGPPRRIVLEPTLVERGSGEIPPSD
ncbi:LacI family DNA-binding transcriptional regulator [Terracoccus luteus]|uniref:LacI family DNA-binding transcriptional regulator n=1 Tax=Terracoccus luteus TaxID=53356 RepID=UPI001FEA83BA|nr:LacI family DNA-binding transcriptional regulator [Terracoccus luteus]